MDAVTNGRLVDIIKHGGVQQGLKFLSDKCSFKVGSHTLAVDLDRLFKKYQHYNKSKGRVKGKENFDRFMNAPYLFPVPKSSDVGCNQKSNSASKLSHASDSDSFNAEVYERVARSLADEVYELKDKNQRLEEELNVTIDEKDLLNDSIDKVENDLSKSKKQLKRTANRETYWRQKCIKLNEVNDNEKVYTQDEVNDFQVMIDNLKAENNLKSHQISELLDQISKLENKIDNLKKIENAQFYNEDSKSYHFSLHSCVYSLLDKSVPYESINPVIRSVLKLVNKAPNKLPSVGTIHNWSVERGLIAKEQICETKNNLDTTLHTDETSKYGQKWGAFGTRDSQGNYILLGLRDMATKSSHDTLETFKDILNDLEEVSQGTGNKVLVNIKNTMSDRASTETKFNELLKDYRQNILPQVFENFEIMSQEEKQSLSRMNNFFCGLHTLVHMADTAQKSLYETEKLHFDDGKIPILNKLFEKPGQPGTIRLIFTACKSFARRGDQKNGCHGSFMTFISEFLKENKLPFPLQPLKGNRFNILFTNAGHIYYFEKHMKEFLDKSPVLNSLLASVQYDLSQPYFLAGCKALGLLSKYVTTPLWRCIENNDISISMMNERYLKLLTYLEDCSLNLEDFITGKLLLFDDVPVKNDIIHEYLIEKSDVDCHVIVILSVLLPALAQLIKRQYCDHLPGGIHNTLNEDETCSVDKHNKFPERVFSYLDHILSEKPNITTLVMESHISFSLNKTGDWLEKKENQQEIIEKCRKNVHTEKLKFKQREQIIKAKRLEKQNEEFRKKEELEQKRIQKLEKETIDMSYYGLWQTEDQMKIKLNEIKSKSEKEEALRVQLRFRKNVFNQKCDENVFTFSRILNGKRVLLGVDELYSNVLKLINKSHQMPSPEEPHLLVGKNIDHRYLEEDGSSKWYSGRVISQVPGFPNWFNVIYDGDEDIYTARLGEEYAEGDVVLRM